ncbi:uncharacterized protein CTHT_0073820 [Thermochaetoides thermophila DSM 1495]|uniref:MICOS complex subunit MIC60 n=1 Tax=Chaetomium thermophilum (strain DSM 1495 / CBS 144.50 / IMI 039719) TaxID=759272 RepID=G0SHY5_CHATD|nr:hypothetical protein CTHT_0073820 [Thermochaetoides thermophila DSM 1495]EGS17055.1 hypothetical protein CTHT_0073820 [Thermochaetoides thermophila DSM 1495]
MLRTSLPSVRALGSRPAAVTAAAGRQWQLAAARRAQLNVAQLVSGAIIVSLSVRANSTLQRFYTDDAKPASPETTTSTTTTAPPPPPPPPPQTTPLPPPPKKKAGFFRRLRNYILTLTFLSALAFGGGVWYSRVNDNFHDFFTTYVPYGEQAVLYLEELDLKKRFPNIADRVGSSRRSDLGDSVKVAPHSGASWRVADGSEISARQSSSIQAVESAKKEAKVTRAKPAVIEEAKKKEEEKEEQTPKEAAASVVQEKKTVPKPEPPKSEPSSPAAAIVPAAALVEEKKEEEEVKKKKWKAPEVDEPSRWPPASPIDPITVPDAAEPVVQELVRMLNDIITVINHDGANEKYGATIGKAKEKIAKVGQKIRDMKAAAEQEAAQQVKQKIDEFDKTANELVSRLESVIVAQEQAFRREFEEEMARVKASYDAKVQLIQQRERQLAEQRLQNQLLEQAVELQRHFAREVQEQVERERDGRLGRLQELSAAVADLERLTADWNSVIDTNLRTQQLHVAVEAVRASLDDARHPRPFIRELVALKEIAAGDPVVDAAIASIPPSAYQRGISTRAELIDRFRRVANEVRKASLLPEDAGLASHASSYVLSKVLFKKPVPATTTTTAGAVGDDVESILARTQAFLEEGDLDNAAREMNALTGWSKTLSRDWLAEVRKVLEVRQALEVIQAEARLQSLRLEQQ